MDEPRLIDVKVSQSDLEAAVSGIREDLLASLTEALAGARQAVKAPRGRTLNEMQRTLQDSASVLNALEKGAAAVSTLLSGSDGKLKGIVDGLKAAGSAATDIASRLTGLPISEIYETTLGLVESIVDQVSLWTTLGDEAYQQDLARLRTLEQVVTLEQARIDAMTRELDLHDRLDRVFERRQDPSSQQAFTQQRIGQLQGELQRGVDSLFDVEGVNRRVGLPDFDDPESVARFLMDLEEEQGRRTRWVDDRRQRIADGGISAGRQAELEQEIAEHEALLALIDSLQQNSERLLDDMAELDDLQRANLERDLAALDHQLAMGQFAGNELQFLERKLAIQKALEAQALEDYQNLLISERELWDIQEARAKLEADILALKEAQLDIDGEQGQLLRQQFLDRQALILQSRLDGQDRSDAIAALESAILQMMADGGVPDSVLQRTQAAFASASYDSGTPFVPYDQLAWVHEGERILTQTENQKLLEILARMAFQPQEAQGVFAPVITITTDGDPNALVLRLRRELSDLHESWHRRDGTSATRRLA